MGEFTQFRAIRHIAAKGETMTKPPSKLAEPFNPSLDLSLAELELDVRFTGLQREVIKGLLADNRLLRHYAEDGATDVELGAIFGIPVTAFAPFSALLAKSRAELKHRIRRAQLAAADHGSPDALTYLAKKYLDRPKKGAAT